ncbi:DUF3800 domain-containing protein [Thermodesulfobacteriota bacterium]
MTPNPQGGWERSVSAERLKNLSMEYLVYSDESYITAERYRSIGAVSFPRSYEAEINSRLEFILSDSCVEEFKWNKLKTAKYRFCAEKLTDFLFEILFDKSVRVDVIIWDTQDSRHKIPGRDDDANFARMFFHLMRNLMQRREKDSDWYVCPDENLAIDWATIQDCLVSAGRWQQYFESQLFGDAFSEQFFHIQEFDQVISKDTPLCQIADFLAGLAVFSKNSYEKYCLWCDSEKEQMSLFDHVEPPDLSNKEKERFPILKTFLKKCRAKRLGVSIKTNHCLCTPNPHNPINFWHYTPQHPHDKAPLRESSPF